MVKTNSKKTPVKKAPVTKKGSSKSGPKNVDWYSARKDYLGDSTLSLDDIAKKYGVSKTAVGNRAKAEDWTNLRQDLYERAFTKFTEKLLDEKSSANNRHLTHWQNLQALANNSIVDLAERNYERNKAGHLILVDGKPIPKPLNTFVLEKLAKTLKIAIDGERVVLGLPTSVSAITDPTGGSVWSGFSDMVKAAEKVLSENGQESSGGDT
ncbi:MAG: hypothetical protein IPN34_27525 [Planctomycetes bacterium]|nr:hypothetical protein [Planctomycetota bacterium]